jgi:hypothetical protein
MWMGDLFVISGLCEKRAEIAGRISELERTTDQLRAELIHVDAVLRLFRPEIDLETIPEKTRKPRQSDYFGRGKITRARLEILRDAEGDGWLTADEITVKIMRIKGLDPAVDGGCDRISLGEFCNRSTH